MRTTYFNAWLDEYNDYMRLFEMFGDEEYYKEANEIIESLNAMVSRKESYRMLLCKIESNNMHKL
ncbi:hypothetical protein HQN89_35600 [Paenibacillus frigoriresistens]|uniref:hypothetical protein n=1 Tax=Paenibacillus alginolyticus TaxID=59839 RepID=UPI00156556B8|nr:hypothetical protein [Paenibacillus frigoriresistens]NRF96124.1 hypothetical protein [Paenibacillus frigoriresistens]